MIKYNDKLMRIIVKKKTFVQIFFSEKLRPSGVVHIILRYTSWMKLSKELFQRFRCTSAKSNRRPWATKKYQCTCI